MFDFVSRGTVPCQKVRVGILFLIQLILVGLFACSQSLVLPTDHLDGAFQTASGLHRLFAGQILGKDFFTYLGLGPLLSNYPLFYIAGANLWASQFAAHFLGLALMCFCVGFLTSLLVKKQRVQNGLLAGVIFASGFLLLYPLLSSDDRAMILPGVSLKLLRAFVPYLTAAVFYGLIRSSLRPWAYHVSCGVLMGSVALWSNDFGFTTAALFLVLAVGGSVRTGRFSILGTVVLGGTALLTACGLLALITHGHVMEFLSYNFLDVARDQFWYFGYWSDESRIWMKADSIRKLIRDIGDWRLGVLIFVTIQAFRKKTVELVLISYIGWALVAGGLVPTVGGHRGEYFKSLLYWSQILVNVTVILTLARWAGSRLRSKWVINSVMTFGAVAIVVMATRYTLALADVRSSPQYFYVPELGGYLPIEWRDEVALGRTAEAQDLAYEYWQIINAVSKHHAPVTGDSLISALGRQRDKAQAMIAQLPLYVSSTFLDSEKPVGFVPWSVAANYWFFETVLHNYEPTQIAPNLLLWKRSAYQSWPETSCEIVPDDGATPTRKALRLKDGKAGEFYEVKLSYTWAGARTRTLLMLRTRFNWNARGFLSISPYASEVTVPVFVEPGEPPTFEFKVSPHAEDVRLLTLHSCTASVMGPQMKRLYDPSVFKNSVLDVE